MVQGGGESIVDVSVRVRDFLEQLAVRHAGGRVILVAHGGVIHNLHYLTTGKKPPGKIINCGMYVWDACLYLRTQVCMGYDV